MHLTSLESNFVLVSFGTWANATQLKTCKWLMEGLYPHQTFFVVMLKITLIGIQFWIYVAFAQNLWSNSICYNIHFTLSTSVWFFFQLHHFVLVVWNGCLLHNAILLVKCIEIIKVIFVTSITFDCFDLLSSSIFYQSFENFKFVKHTKFSLRGIKKHFLWEIINKSF
jgi:hypothetical protein